MTRPDGTMIPPMGCIADIPIPPALGNGPSIMDMAQAVLAQMQALNAQHANLLDELRAERHRLEAISNRLDQ